MQPTNEPTCCLKELEADAPDVYHVFALVALWFPAWQVSRAVVLLVSPAVCLHTH